MHKISVKHPVSKGVVMGNVFLYRPEKFEADESLIDADGIEREIAKYHEAVAAARAQIESLAKTSEIFAAHLDVLDDPVLQAAVVDRIGKARMNAELALVEAREEIAAMFDGIDDEYLRERVADIRDVCGRIQRSLRGVEHFGLSAIDRPVVLVAEDLTPSDTAGLDKEFVLGFITAAGGPTSHVAIMARSLELPAIVGVEGIADMLRDGDFVVLDAVDGEIVIEPDHHAVSLYREKASIQRERRRMLEAMRGLPAQTRDGHRVAICANVGSLRDVHNAIGYGIDGIGLLRSEFLYMESDHFPTEDEQFAVYKSAAQLCAGEVIIRTLDIGGDKALPYYRFPQEENPFLGWRAIRLCLDMVDVFKTQLRAILRASAFGAVKIMYPMVISLDELRRANEILAVCKRELESEGLAFDADIPAGIMIETPAAVFCIDELAREADFFSIGTNDLTQYLLAVDRGNQKVAGLYDAFHPAVLRAIRTIIDAAHRHGIPVGMCGEFAGDERAIPVLLGLGLDEFSMAASQVPEARYLIRSTDIESARGLAAAACVAATRAEVHALLKRN